MRKKTLAGIVGSLMVVGSALASPPSDGTDQSRDLVSVERVQRADETNRVGSFTLGLYGVLTISAVALVAPYLERSYRDKDDCFG